MVCTIGIDLGTSSCKGVLYDSGGQVLDYQVAPYPTAQPRPGWVEQDPNQWTQAVRSACRRLADNPRWLDVKAVGLSGQMHALTLIDRAGQPVLPAIGWQDTRSSEIAAKLSTEMKERISRVTGNLPHTIMTLLPLLWLKETSPEFLRHTWQLLLPKDYLRFKLTGKIATEPSDASGTALFDLNAQEWSADLIHRFELPDNILPPVLPSADIGGTVSRSGWELTGLPVGLPVVIGAGDLAAEAFSTGENSPQTIIIRYGTAGAVMAFSATPLRGLFHCYATVEKNRWMLVAGTHSCGSTLEWARANLLGKSTYADMFMAAKQVDPGANGLIFVPHLAGERAPYFNPNLQAHFFGLTLNHGYGHVIRALLEGVAFSLRDASSILPNVDGIETAKFMGGQGEHDFWGQLLADVFDRPVRWFPHAGPAVGAAMMAAKTLGYLPQSEESAIEFIPRVSYEKAFARYREAIKATASCIELSEPGYTG